MQNVGNNKAYTKWLPGFAALAMLAACGSDNEITMKNLAGSYELQQVRCDDGSVVSPAQLGGVVTIVFAEPNVFQVNAPGAQGTVTYITVSGNTIIDQQQGTSITAYLDGKNLSLRSTDLSYCGSSYNSYNNGHTNNTTYGSGAGGELILIKR